MRRFAIPLAAVSMLVAAAPAGAQQDDGVVVARSGEVTLHVLDAKGERCLSFVRGGVSGEQTCNRDRGSQLLVGQGSGQTLVGAAVPAEALSIEVRRAGALLATGPTVVADAYKGRGAAALRFAVVGLPRGARTDGLRVRALDAPGAPVAVLAAGDGTGLLVTRARSVLGGRFGRVRWGVYAKRTSELGSSVANLDREVVSECVETGTFGVRDGGTSEECTSEDPLQGLLGRSTGTPGAVGAIEACDEGFRLVSGGVAGRVVGVRVLLGDGRTVAARTARRTDVDETRFAVAVPGGAAVRGVRVVRAGGRPVPMAFSAPPLAVTCAGPDVGALGTSTTFAFTGDFFTRPVAPVGPVTTIPGRPAVRIADGPAGTLCLTVDDAPFTALGCRAVSTGLDNLAGTFDDYSRPRRFVIAVPARVAAVRITGRGGGVRVLPSVDAAGYAGPYAGKVRFVGGNGTISGFARTELLDAAGKVLHTDVDNSPEGTFDAPRAGTPQRRAGTPGRPSLWQTVLRTARTADVCLALTAGPPPGAGERCQAAGTVPFAALVSVPCATKRLSLGVVVPAGARVVVDTGRGSAQPLRLTRGAAVLTLPTSVALRSLTILRRGRKPLRVLVAAPPGTEQCGWTAAPDAEGR